MPPKKMPPPPKKAPSPAQLKAREAFKKMVQEKSKKK